MIWVSGRTRVTLCLLRAHASTLDERDLFNYTPPSFYFSAGIERLPTRNLFLRAILGSTTREFLSGIYLQTTGKYDERVVVMVH